MSNTKDQEFENEVTPEQVDDTAAEENTDFENTTEEVETVEEEDVDSNDTEDDDKDDSTVEDEEYTHEESGNNDNTDSEFSEEQFNAMNNELESLRAEVVELRNFKLKIENQQKQSLIDSYFMLSDEDKQEIIDHMAEYSYDDIKAKLAIMYVEQNVDFTKVDGQSDDEPSPEMTFSLEDETTTEQLTDLQRALRNASK